MTAAGIVLALVASVVTSVVAAAPLDVPAATTQEESKPLGPIAVDVVLVAPPALGVPLAVIVTARADAAAADRLELEVHADDSAALVVGGQSEPVDRGGARSWIVTVVPVRASGGNLNVVVSGEIEGVAQAQSVTIQVRPPGAEPAFRPPLSVRPVEAAGEKLSLLPVEERF